MAIARPLNPSPAPVLELRPEVRARRALACRKKFLEYFPDGFRDETYLETERRKLAPAQAGKHFPQVPTRPVMRRGSGEMTVG